MLFQLHDLSEDPHAIERTTVAAKAALLSYNDLASANVELINVSENAKFLVTLPKQFDRFIMRVHRRGYHSEVEILSELYWADALSKAEGIRTPKAIKNQHGALVTKIDDEFTDAPRYCVLFEFLPGSEAIPGNAVLGYETLGGLTAKMHRHARSWSPPEWFTRFSWNFDAAFGATSRWGRWQDGIGVNKDELELLTRLQVVLDRRLLKYGSNSDKYGLIHADMRLSNLLWSNFDDVAVIDFDDCGKSWFLYDLGSALSFIEDDPMVEEYINAWLSGYRTITAIDEKDEAEVWTFVLFRRLLLLAWIGSHQGAEIARELGPTFTAGTCALADNFLSENKG